VWQEKCKCNKGALHGPFSYVSYKEGKRVYYKYISSERIKEILQSIKDYQFFQEKGGYTIELNVIISPENILKMVYNFLKL
jgi:(2Fe-2S) ferredoxin